MHNFFKINLLEEKDPCPDPIIWDQENNSDDFHDTNEWTNKSTAS